MKTITEYINESVFDKNLATREIEKINPEDIENRDDAILYILQNYKTEKIKSWEPKGKALKIIYNSNLSMRIDFINRYEYLFTIYGPNDEEIYDCNSTREAYQTHWDTFLDIKKYADSLKRARSNFGRNKGMVERSHRIADKIYQYL